MRILKNLRSHFCLSGILPPSEPHSGLHSHRPAWMRFVLLFFPVLSSCMFLPYIAININNFGSVTNALYVLCGCVNALFLHFHLIMNRRKVRELFAGIQSTTNEREYHLLPGCQKIFDSTSFSGIANGKGGIYVEADALIDQVFKYTFILWTTFAIPVGLQPFLSAFVDFVMGRYGEDSWAIIYETIWYVISIVGPWFWE